MTEETLNIHDLLCCPFHKESGLEWEEDNLVCSKCGKNYELLKYGSIVIPNFLIEDKNWIRGKRDINSQFIKLVQGDILIDQIQNNKIVLDVGCGENPRGNINVDCYIPDRLPTNFILANAEYLPFRFNSIDTVLSYYNIEHLLNPPDFLLTISKIAKENIVILTDNSEWIGDIFFRLYGKGRIFHDEHYYKWSVEYLRNLVKRIGLTQSNVSLVNNSKNQFVSLLSKLGRIPRIGNFFYRDIKMEILIERPANQFNNSK